MKKRSIFIAIVFLLAITIVTGCMSSTIRDVPVPAAPPVNNGSIEAADEYEYSLLWGPDYSAYGGSEKVIGVEITKYIGSSDTVSIPATLDGYDVIAIGERAFFQTGFVEINIPSSVLRISSDAFDGNESLSYIPIGSDRVTVNNRVFFGGTIWQVLDIQDGKALLIRYYVMQDSRQFHSKDETVTWEASDIRQYLNGEFINDTFTTDEKSMIFETTVTNEPDADVTTDCVFLLSCDEAERYFDNQNRRRGRLEYEKTEENWMTGGTIQTTGTDWWLRSHSSGYNRLIFHVMHDGNIGTTMLTVYDTTNAKNRHGVRPALWLIL